MDDSSAPAIPVVCGPTAAGKTRLALWLAERTDVTIVSADSRQLYRGFDVGTAKPTAAERESVPHCGIDVLDPTQRASAAWWADHADAWIREALAQQRVPLVVGGTGLYLRALFGTLFEEPPLDEARRVELQRELGSCDTETLRRWTREIDPARASLGRTQLLRALEIALLTGRRVSELHLERKRPARWSARYLVVDPGPELAMRIEARVRTMMEDGWREEVRRLIDQVPGDAPAWNAAGYRAIRLLENGELAERDAVQRVIVDTRQYAKRQRTWFRHQLAGDDVTRLDPRDPGWEARALSWWQTWHA
ncbi:MAG TPA: tRNA (adenosine(37)-N6)-dimethylallyltransferase MiaA [Gemmatimonadaceae bacterium]|nr:tRNA (adenosine(37)-N6)-dimethylallyltransferase MiaA [Gemmatimonadaceae bacterium]